MQIPSTATLGARLGSLPPRADADNYARPGSNDSMKLVLQLSARNLQSLDSKRHTRHDYFATVEVRDPDGGSGWHNIGKTEVVYNSSGPSWAATFSTDYSFNVAKLFRFRVNRLDPAAAPGSTRKFEPLGEMQCTIATIVLADKQVVCERLRPIHGRRLPCAVDSAKSYPMLSIRAEEERGDLGDSVTLQFSVTNLRRSARPFYTLKRENTDGTFSPVQFSEVHRSYDRRKVNYFKPLTVSLGKLVNSDLCRKLRIEFSDYDRGGKHNSGGYADFSLKSLKNFSEYGKKCKFELCKMKASGVKSGYGTVSIVKFEITNSFTFLDYIRSGMEINCVFAVDMSSTNGNPRDPRSLQYNCRRTPNEYVIALREVGSVLAQYDNDKKFPAYGFSACLPTDFRYMSYCFALSGDATRAECDGIDGVIENYYRSLDNVAPHQPCHLNPVIQHVISQCVKSDRESNHSIYTVLLLITDGDYHDQKRVADSICAAADLPLSIVIVGIGNSEFPLLDELDGDDVRLCNSDGVPAARDIVQVVHFHKHRHSPAALARETLAEIPSQLISFMRSQGLRPNDVEKIVKNRPPPSTPTTPSHGASGAELVLGITPPPNEPQTPEFSINSLSDLHIGDSRHSFYSASSDGNGNTTTPHYVAKPTPPQSYAAAPTSYMSPLRPPIDDGRSPMQASILTLNLPPGIAQNNSNTNNYQLPQHLDTHTRQNGNNNNNNTIHGGNGNQQQQYHQQQAPHYLNNNQHHSTQDRW